MLAVAIAVTTGAMLAVVATLAVAIQVATTRLQLFLPCDSAVGNALPANSVLLAEDDSQC